MRDEFGTEQPTREEREAAHFAEHGDGMSLEARTQLLGQIAQMVNAAQHSIEVAVAVQVITYRYPDDQTERNRTGAGRTITITLDGGEGSGQLGEVPAGTFPESFPEAAPEAASGPGTVKTSGEPAAAATGARDASRGQDDRQA